MSNNFSLSDYYWRCQIIGLTLYWLLLCYAGSLSLGNGDETLTRLTIRYSIYIVGVLLASHLLRYLIKKNHWVTQDAKAFWQRILAASLVIGLLFTLINWPFDTLVDGLFPPPESRSQMMIDLESSISVRVVFGGIYNAIFLMSWSLIYWSVHIWYKNVQMKVMNQALVIEQKNAELTHLRSQLNPHFLFNSLNNIRAMIHLNGDKASDMVTELAQLLRYSLLHSNDLVSLEKEMEIVDCFLNLEKVRLAERLNIELNIDQDSLTCQLPPMLLQSLVENAVKHGINALRVGGLLTISSENQPQGLLVIITNDGNLQQGISGLGVGLKNCRQRLTLLYGEVSSLTLEQQDNKVVTRVFIPHKKAQEGA